MINRASIKAAIRRIVGHDGRTFQVTADFLGVAKSDVSYWCSDSHERHIPFDHLVDLDAVSNDSVLKEWAASRGYDLVKRKPIAEDDANILKVVGGFSRDSGKLGEVVLDAAADYHFTPAEKRLIRDNIAPVKDRIADLERAIGG